ncbi:MAG: M56 family metallopeptidase [Oscillospiraceae bacterium]
MVHDLLPTLGALTLGGSAAVILFALASRASRARYGARWRCWVWALLCLRLAIPFSFFSLHQEESQAPIQLSLPSDTVLYEYTPPQQSAPSPEEPTGTPDHATQPSADVPAAGEPAETQASDTPKREFSISLSEVLVILWLAGMAAMAVWALVSHLRFLRYLRRWGRPVQDPGTIRLYNQLGDQLKLDHRPNLCTCTGLRAPMLEGLIHPMILLPEEMMEGDSLRYALIHELTHYKRRDIWLKTLALLANIVHWFNPFMWYMVRLVERDTELACDEAALRQLPPEDHAAYGHTILSAVERLKLKSGSK